MVERARMTEPERAEAAARQAFNRMVAAGTDPKEATDWITRELADLTFKAVDFAAQLRKVNR